MSEQPQLTAIIALRVSTPSQVNNAINPEGYSIPEQRDSCRRYCQIQLGGVEVIDEVIEPGISGSDIAKRPHVKELLEKVDQLHPDFVVYFDLSRSARNDYDSQWLWRELVERRGVLIQSTQERIDNTPNGRMIYSITAAVNANRIRQDAEKVKGGLARKFLEGGHMGPAPIGYRNDELLLPGRKVRIVTVDQARADLVRDAFGLYATGNLTLSTLTDILDVKGLRWRATPKKPERPMSRASVYNMLRDDFYIGTVTFKGQKRPGIHEALIEETLFERVQQVLKAHAAGGDRGRKHDHFLVGNIFICDHCLCRLAYGRHRSKTGNVYEYFSCLSRVRDTGPCGARYLQVDPVEAAIEAYHRTLLYTPEQQDRLREEVREFVSARVDTAKQQAAVHQRRLEALKAEQKNLIQLHHKGLVDDAVLAEEQERITLERAHALQLIEHANYEVADVMEALEEALLLVDETFPYGEADDPVLWELINQATHLEIRPFIRKDWDGKGTPPVCAHGRRDPAYDAADFVLGVSRSDHAGRTSRQGQAALAGPRVRNRSTAPRWILATRPRMHAIYVIYLVFIGRNREG
jgi:site-specific DNA recombinase